MPERFWIQDFETGIDRLRIHFITEHGQVKSVIVIQYEAFIDGKWRPIVRFDEAHGFFHRDVLFPSGEQEKKAQPANEMDVALTEAIKYIKLSWHKHRQTYEELYFGKK